MSRGPKVKTKHMNVLLSDRESELLNKYAVGYGAKTKVIRETGLNKFIRKCEIKEKEA